MLLRILLAWILLAGMAFCQSPTISGVVPLDGFVYIVHWTSQEKCFECTNRYLMACIPPDSDCNVPMKAVDHFELAATKEAALVIANDIGTTRTFTWDGSHSFIGIGLPQATPRPKGTLVAIYMSKPLPFNMAVKDVEIPQPPKIEKSTVVTLDEHLNK